MKDFLNKLVVICFANLNNIIIVVLRENQFKEARFTNYLPTLYNKTEALNSALTHVLHVELSTNPHP